MYSKDFRCIALKLAKRDGIKQACAFLKIHRTTLWRWKKDNIIKKKEKQKIRKNRLFDEVKDSLICLLQSTPLLTITKIQSNLHKHVSVNTLKKYLNKLNFSRKRIQLRGSSNKTKIDDVIKAFVDQYKLLKSQGKEIICLDECGFSERLRPIYGYSKKGSSIILKIPGGWKNYSLLMAIYPSGNFKYMIKQGSINKDSFQSFVHSIKDNSNQVFLMDNASIHKNLNNTNILYTPPYSPEFNAIELCFSKVKRYFRNLLVKDDVPNAIRDSLKETMQSQFISNCYKHVETYVSAFK